MHNMFSIAVNIESFLLGNVQIIKPTVIVMACQM